MKQTAFDTKRKAEELLRKAINIWQQTEHSEYLEGLEDDPVFVLLMNALAYQSNEIDSEIEQIKTDVVEEFENLLSLDFTGSPVPACIAVSLTPYDNLNSKVVNNRSQFSISDKKRSFSLLPLLNTLAINAQLESVTRMDERRWCVTMGISQSLHDLRGWSFAIKNRCYHQLKVSLERKNGTLVPLKIIGPEKYSELPMSKDFSVDTLLYNRTHAQTVGGGRHGALSSNMNWCAMDIFARENLRMYFIDSDDGNAVINEERDSFDLIFEFTGIRDDFSFRKEDFIVNTNILVNAERHNVQLSNDSPVARMTGGRDHTATYFLHLLRPEEDQIFGSLPLQVRRVMSDRFNHTKLQKIIYNLVGKYHSDFYAFLALGMKSADSNIQRMRRVLADMQKDMETADSPIDEGVYVMIDGLYNLQFTTPVSLRVDYLTTNGAGANEAFMTGELAPCDGITTVERCTPPVPGVDAIRNGDAERQASKYLLTTGDRLVTPYDIKLFVKTELLTRYDIVKEMISSIKVTREHLDQGTFHTFQIIVNVLLNDNKFIKRTFVDKIPTVEIYLEKMIEVRSSNVFPIKVNLQVLKK